MCQYEPISQYLIFFPPISLFALAPIIQYRSCSTVNVIIPTPFTQHPLITLKACIEKNTMCYFCLSAHIELNRKRLPACSGIHQKPQLLSAFSLSANDVHTIRCQSDEAPFHHTWGFSYLTQRQTQGFSHSVLSLQTMAL